MNPSRLKSTYLIEALLICAVRLSAIVRTLPSYDYGGLEDRGANVWKAANGGDEIADAGVKRFRQQEV